MICRRSKIFWQQDKGSTLFIIVSSIHFFVWCMFSVLPGGFDCLTGHTVLRAQVEVFCAAAVIHSHLCICQLNPPTHNQPFQQPDRTHSAAGSTLLNPLRASAVTR
jgi:hypothetical protein